MDGAVAAVIVVTFAASAGAEGDGPTIAFGLTLVGADQSRGGGLAGVPNFHEAVATAYERRIEKERVVGKRWGLRLARESLGECVFGGSY